MDIVPQKLDLALQGVLHQIFGSHVQHAKQNMTQIGAKVL